VQRLREAADEERLSEARHTFEQAVTACEEAHEDAVDDFLVTDYGLSDFSARFFERLSEGLDVGVAREGGLCAHGGA
jgi:hypothetical protein